ncbi:MAG TPA: tetratricopeptide repeat protein [Bryobacteraceae bacterium]|nr:tetratricopeptide repeat protein [Bryobacteraceae bacterium]
MTFRSLAVAAAGMAFLAVNALAQITTIEGIVKGTDGKPVQGAEVHITRTDIKGNYKTKTDKKGHYLYMGLPMGFYDVEIMIDGKSADKQTKIKTSPGDPIPVNFDLAADQQSGARQQAAMQQAAMTGQLTDDAKRGMSKEQVAAMEKQIKDQSDKIKKNKELNDAFNEAMTDVQNKQYDQAIAAFQKASELDPNQLAVWTNMADAYAKNAEGKTGPDFDSNMQKSLDAYGKALALKPDDAGLHNNYGLALAKAKKFDDAQAELKKAADLDPPNGGKYYYNLGALEVNAGQPQAAGDAFKKAIELTPTYADAYYQYGVTLLGQAKTDPSTGKVTPAAGTVEAFQKYLELAPTGQYAQPAKDMLTSLGSSIQTNFSDPNAKKGKKK